MDRYADEVRQQYGVEIVPDIPTLCRKVDAVLLESVDGRVHLEQARPVIAAHKPLFIDKPMAAKLKDAREIAAWRKAAGVPGSAPPACVSAPSERPDEIPRPHRRHHWGPGPLEAHHPLELAWYAIHPIELLYT